MRPHEHDPHPLSTSTCRPKNDSLSQKCVGCCNGYPSGKFSIIHLPNFRSMMTFFSLFIQIILFSHANRKFLNSLFGSPHAPDPPLPVHMRLPPPSVWTS